MVIRSVSKSIVSVRCQRKASPTNSTCGALGPRSSANSARVSARVRRHNTTSPSSGLPPCLAN
eukprot:scaffold62477_cov53-Phaeocystis_antarctica.AAC.2